MPSGLGIWEASCIDKHIVTTLVAFTRALQTTHGPKGSWGLKPSGVVRLQLNNPSRRLWHENPASLISKIA
jgi:hypothetical protein